MSLIKVSMKNEDLENSSLRGLKKNQNAKISFCCKENKHLNTNN